MPTLPHSWAVDGGSSISAGVGDVNGTCSYCAFRTFDACCELLSQGGRVQIVIRRVSGATFENGQESVRQRVSTNSSAEYGYDRR